MTPEEIDQRAAAAADRIKRMGWFRAPTSFLSAPFEEIQIVVADAIRMAIAAEMTALERAMEAQQAEDDNPRGRYL